jgi:hypothetical protein
LLFRVVIAEEISQSDSNEGFPADLSVRVWSGSEYFVPESKASKWTRRQSSYRSQLCIGRGVSGQAVSFLYRESVNSMWTVG